MNQQLQGVKGEFGTKPNYGTCCFLQPSQTGEFGLVCLVRWLDGGGDQEATRQGRSARDPQSLRPDVGPKHCTAPCRRAARAETRTHDATLRSGRLSTWPPMQPSWNFPTPAPTKIAPAPQIGLSTASPKKCTSSYICLRKASIGCNTSSLPHSSRSGQPTPKTSQCCIKAGGAMPGG